MVRKMMNIDPHEAKIVGKKYPMGKVSTVDNNYFAKLC